MASDIGTAGQWLDGYSETGAVSAAANATVEDRFVGALEARVGSDITGSFDLGSWAGSVTGRIGYLGHWDSGDSDAGITQTLAEDAQHLNALCLGATLRHA